MPLAIFDPMNQALAKMSVAGQRSESPTGFSPYITARIGRGFTAFFANWFEYFNIYSSRYISTLVFHLLEITVSKAEAIDE
ncbi:hypothetical protein [Photorhabdus australis]|uniref:hypothetical protein n=1 Tax=Photorhabdus australis TaxID=286156 RepID=UPI0008167ECC|nr:hypothetical protein [Photorhabdus australis]